MNFLSTSPKVEVEKLLKKNGFQVLGKKVKGSVIVRFDGRDHYGELEAEYTVRKNGKEYAVLTRSGENDLDPTEPALRRRLIEYDRLFGLKGILIVDQQEGEIHEISFKYPRERGLDFYFQFIVAVFIVFAVIGIIWLMAYIKLF